MKSLKVVIFAAIFTLNAATDASLLTLGNACPFAVLGGSAVTGAALVQVGGDVGVSPGTAITTFPVSVDVTGDYHFGDTSSAAAHTALNYAISQAKAQTPSVILSAAAIDIGGQTLTPGVYKVGTSLAITGTLKLDAKKDASAAWIFQIGTTFGTAAASKVEIINLPKGSMSGDHVWWQVGTSATIGATSTVLGSIMATASITTGAGSATGPLLANIGAVTLGAGAIVNTDNKCEKVYPPAPDNPLDTFVVIGDACKFAVLGGSAVTGAALVEVGGDVGVSPGTAITTFPAGVTVTGDYHAGDNNAATAHSALNSAISQAKARTPTETLSAAAVDIGGRTLIPGVYKVGTSLAITGTLKLDAKKDASAAWIFQIGTTFGPAAASKVEIINAPDNGMDGNHIWWQVGTSATIGATSTVPGSIIATTSITTGAGSITGPLLASDGAVTLGAGAIVNADNKCAVTK